jgi:hypothetical protein
MAALIDIGARPTKDHVMVGAPSQHITRLNCFQELDFLKTIFLLAPTQKGIPPGCLITMVSTLQVVVTTSNFSVYPLWHQRQLEYGPL